MANYQSTHTGAEIDAGIDLLDKNSATNGQVLTANGTGGATWQDAKGTEVVANPVLAGTESDLTGLEVAGTKYKVPTGGSGVGTKFYLHTVVTSNYTFYFVNHYPDTYTPTNLAAKAFINSIAFNRYIGTSIRNKLYAFDLEIAIEGDFGDLTDFRNSPNVIQKGNAISYFGNDGQEVTITATNFGTYVSDTVAEIALF